MFSPAARRLEVETVPGLALHMVDQPRSQKEIARRLLPLVARSLD